MASNIAQGKLSAEVQTPVLVVGGGLVGLSAAMFLAWHKVPVILVEKHPGSSLHPRAMGYTPRTLENLRAVGLGDRVEQAPPNFRLRRITVESLAGKWHEETDWTPSSGADKKPVEPKRAEYSPCSGAAIAQDRLEPILRDRAIELGADIRLSTELLSFKEQDDGVVCVVRQRSDGTEYTIRADYLIAADGHKSPIRTGLHIGQHGRGHIQTVRSVLFRAPLEEYLRSGVSQFNIERPDLRAFLTTYNDGRWVLIFTDNNEREEASLKNAICSAIGRTDLPIEIVTTGKWEMGGLIADSYASKRIFLAGDAAHTLPPTRGGFGANTGIDDVHNLAWKLAFVTSGLSTPDLLKTYDAERRAIGDLRHDQTFARPDYKKFAGDYKTDCQILDDTALELGQLYRSAAVLGAGAELPPAQKPDEWVGQPGTRAPHHWILKGGQRTSTLDLFQHGFVVLAMNDQWKPAVEKAKAELGLKIDCFLIDSDITAEVPLGALLGIGSAGASLVRPDGYIAWRATELPSSTSPEQSLISALKVIISHNSKA